MKEIPLDPGTRICFSNNGDCNVRYGVVVTAPPESNSYILVRPEEHEDGQYPLFMVVPCNAHITVCEF